MESIRVFVAALIAVGMSASAAGQIAPVVASPPAAAAPAQSAPTPIPRTMFIQTMNQEFRQRDTDNNGILTKKEIELFQYAVLTRANQAHLVALFQQLDADKNGQLSPGEFAGLKLPMPPVNAALLLSQVDLNHDGQVTLVEYRAGKLRNFDNMDADKDGIVSIAEMKAAGIIR